MNSIQKLNSEIDYSDVYTVISLINEALSYSLGPSDIAYYSEFTDINNNKHHQYLAMGNEAPFKIFDLLEQKSIIMVSELSVQRQKIH